MYISYSQCETVCVGECFVVQKGGFVCDLRSTNTNLFWVLESLFGNVYLTEE